MRSSRTSFLLVVGFSVSLTTLNSLVCSDEYDGEGESHGVYDHDQARQAVRRGEVLPMAQLLDHLRRRIPGEVVGVEFDREDGRWVYEFKIVDRIGRLLEVYVDAATGEILSMEHD